MSALTYTSKTAITDSEMETILTTWASDIPKALFVQQYADEDHKYCVYRIHSAAGLKLVVVKVGCDYIIIGELNTTKFDYLLSLFKSVESLSILRNFRDECKKRCTAHAVSEIMVHPTSKLPFFFVDDDSARNVFRVYLEYNKMYKVCIEPLYGTDKTGWEVDINNYDAFGSLDKLGGRVHLDYEKSVFLTHEVK